MNFDNSQVIVYALDLKYFNFQYVGNLCYTHYVNGNPIPKQGPIEISNFRNGTYEAGMFKLTRSEHDSIVGNETTIGYDNYGNEMTISRYGYYVEPFYDCQGYSTPHWLLRKCPVNRSSMTSESTMTAFGKPYEFFCWSTNKQTYSNDVPNTPTGIIEPWPDFNFSMHHDKDFSQFGSLSKFGAFSDWYPFGHNGSYKTDASNPFKISNGNGYVLYAQLKGRTQFDTTYIYYTSAIYANSVDAYVSPQGKTKIKQYSKASLTTESKQNDVEFLGWFDSTDMPILLTTNKNLSYTISRQNMKLFAVWNNPSQIDDQIITLQLKFTAIKRGIEDNMIVDTYCRMIRKDDIVIYVYEKIIPPEGMNWYYGSTPINNNTDFNSLGMIPDNGIIQFTATIE